VDVCNGADAILGAKKKVATVEGDVEVDVAAGTQPNSKIRLEVRELDSRSDRVSFHDFIRIRRWRGTRRWTWPRGHSPTPRSDSRYAN
jgi:hypothetical protein